MFGSGGSVGAGRRRMFGLALLLSVFSMPSAYGQSESDEPLGVEELRALRRDVHADRLANAKAIDASVAEIEDLNEALGTFREWINRQTVAVEISRAQAASAGILLDEALADVAVMDDGIERLGREIRERAVVAFVESDSVATLLETGDPTAAVRRDSFSQSLNLSSDDLVDDLRRAREDLVVGQQAVRDASEAAEDKRRAAEEHLRVLESDAEQYQGLLLASETRFETLLSERQSLAELDQSISSELSEAEAKLATLLGGSGGGSEGGRVDLVSPEDIVDVGYGIEVHREIAESVRQLLEAAQLDGVNLSGGGYRDSAGQIRVRRNNCGTSNYAIYEMPARNCRPPTARPGRSMHEQGKAIDFTYNGSVISSRSGPGWEWLAANASSYGLFNLPSEPWHFSTNGQ